MKTPDMLLNQQASRMYEALLMELQQCNTGHLFARLTEVSYQAAEKYWQLLRQLLTTTSFCSINEEIQFFKTIKPKFVVQLEYYRLISYTDNFCPEVQFTQEVRLFWMRQVLRLEQFCQKHEAFINYYHFGKNKLDCLFFIRRLSEDSLFSIDETISGYDELIAQLWAHERFNIYAREQLAER